MYKTKSTFFVEASGGFEAEESSSTRIINNFGISIFEEGFWRNCFSEDDKVNSFDEVYQLASDMGGAGYIFTGDNDANVMHNSALINLNVVYEAAKKSVKRVFYS